MEKMSVQEFEKIIIEMSEKTFSEFVAKLPEDIAEAVTMHRSWLKLFCDVDYYNAVKEAVKERVAKDLWKQANA